MALNNEPVVRLNGQALSDFGILGSYGFESVALVTFGFLYSLWIQPNPMIVSLWTSAEASVTSSWTTAEASVTTTWTAV